MIIIMNNPVKKSMYSFIVLSPAIDLNMKSEGSWLPLVKFFLKVALNNGVKQVKAVPIKS